MSQLLSLLGEIMYLNYYTYLMKAKKFFMLFTAPPKYEEDLIAFMEGLRSMGILRSFELKKLRYARVFPFRVDCFDFRKGVWKQNWFENNINLPEIFEEPSPNPEIDKIDLFILEELGRNAQVKYTEISQKLGLTRQTVRRHYEHAIKAVYKYAILWFPPLDPDLVSIPIIVKFLDIDRSRPVAVNVPFNHMELRSIDDEYYVMMLLPSMGLYRTLKYLGEKALIDEIYFLDMEHTMGFHVPHNLFDDKIGWLNSFKEGIQKIMEKVEMFRSWI